MRFTDYGNTYKNNHPPPLCNLKGLVEQTLTENELTEEEQNRLKEFYSIISDLCCAERNKPMQLSNHTITRDDIRAMTDALTRDYLIHMIRASEQPKSNPRKYWATVLYNEHLRIKAGITVSTAPRKEKPKNRFLNFEQRKVNYEELIWPDNFPPREECERRVAEMKRQQEAEKKGK